MSGLKKIDKERSNYWRLYGNGGGSNVWPWNFQALFDIWSRVESPYNLRCLIWKNNCNRFTFVDTGEALICMMLFWLLLQDTGDKRDCLKVLWMFCFFLFSPFWLIVTQPLLGAVLLHSLCCNPHIGHQSSVLGWYKARLPKSCSFATRDMYLLDVNIRTACWLVSSNKHHWSPVKVFFKWFYLFFGYLIL